MEIFMTLLTLIFVLIFAILAVIFASQNPMIVTISFYGYSVDGSLAVIILIAVIVGIIIGALVMTPGAVKRSFELRSHRKKIGGLEKTLEVQGEKIAKAERIISTYEPPSEESED
jgi:uncharacterized integral membrane protein